MSRPGPYALVVSGPTTDHPVREQEERRVREAVPEARLLASSGVTPDTIGRLAPHIDGAIVGTALKQDGQTTNPIDPARAQTLTQSACRS